MFTKLRALWAAIKAYKAAKPVIEYVKPYLEKPWVKSILGFLAGLFKADPNAPKVHHERDPDKPLTKDDILHPRDNV
jgi:hypothetical protein